MAASMFSAEAFDIPNGFGGGDWYNALFSSGFRFRI
jgi:hypothetical protein